jgi:hypothetical protein
VVAAAQQGPVLHNVAAAALLLQLLAQPLEVSGADQNSHAVTAAAAAEPRL